MILLRNFSAIQYELSFLAEQRLISAIEAQANLTYRNGESVTVRGSNREQLIGSPHNTVRHPDMAEALFARMWSYLKRVKSWIGIGTIRCSSGHPNWVNTYLTPTFKQGNLIGYKSVRIKPARNQLSGVTDLDACLQNHDSSLQIKQRPGAVLTSIFLPFVVLAVTAAALLFGGAALGVAAIALFFLAIQILSVHQWHRSLNHLGSVSTDYVDSELIARPFSGERGPVARLQMLLISGGANIRTALSLISDVANQTATLVINSQSLRRQPELILSKRRDGADIAVSSSAVGDDLKHTVQQINAQVVRFKS